MLPTAVMIPPEMTTVAFSTGAEEPQRVRRTELAPIERKSRPVDREELLPSAAAARLAAEEGAATAKQAKFLDTSDE